jgi:hypothetical protein
LVELSGLELLDRRVLPAVTATFPAADGVLTVNGDAQDNTIIVSRDAAGTILVNTGGNQSVLVLLSTERSRGMDRHGLSSDRNTLDLYEI